MLFAAGKTCYILAPDLRDAYVQLFYHPVVEMQKKPLQISGWFRQEATVLQ